MMARIRALKPDLFLDEDLAAIPLTARYLFMGLWCLADRAGRLEDRPSRIKAQIFPYEAIDVNGALSALASGRWIQRYEVDGRRLIQIRTWEKHQRPHHTEMPSVLPAPDPLLNGEITVKSPLSNGDAPVSLDHGVRGTDHGVLAMDQEHDAKNASAPAAPAGNIIPPSEPQRPPTSTETRAGRLIETWPERVKRVTGAACPRLKEVREWPDAVALADTYDEATLTRLADAMLRAPSLAGKTRNLAMLRAIAPELLAHLTNGGTPETFGPRAARPPTITPRPASWRLRCPHDPPCSTPEQCQFLQVREVSA